MSKTSHFLTFLFGAAVTAGAAAYGYFNHSHFEPARNPPVVESSKPPPEPPRLVVDTASLESTINESGHPNILVGHRREDGTPDPETVRTLVGVNYGLFVEQADAQAMKNIKDGYLGAGQPRQIFHESPINSQLPHGSQPTTSYDPRSSPVQKSAPTATGPTFAPRYGTPSSGWRHSAE